MTHKSLWAKHTLKHTHTHLEDFHWDARGGEKVTPLSIAQANKDRCLPLLLQFLFCVCVCITCLSGRCWTAACGLCLCIWQCTPSTPHPPFLVWTHGEPSSSFASYQSNWPNDKHTHMHTHAHTRTHSLQILLLLCLGLRGARCEVAHARACVPQTGVCVSFFTFYVCLFLCVCRLSLFVSVLVRIPAYCTWSWVKFCVCVLCVSWLQGSLFCLNLQIFLFRRADSADPGAFNRVCVADPAAFNRVCVFSGLRFTAQWANKFLNTLCVCVLVFVCVCVWLVWVLWYHLTRVITVYVLAEVS